MVCTLVARQFVELVRYKKMRQERNDFVNPLSVHRWATKRLQVLAAVFWPPKQVVGESWRMGETCIKVDGQWRYIYRAVDGAGDTVDFLITSKNVFKVSQTYEKLGR